MTHLEAVPLWLALPIAFFLIAGSTLTLLGTLGLLRLQSFYDRIHAPTLGTSWGTAGILLASIMLFSWTEQRMVIHELIIGTFVMITMPVALMLLGRAALHRDRAEGSPFVPGPLGAKPAGEPAPGDLPHPEDDLAEVLSGMEAAQDPASKLAPKPAGE